jgi:hypothetical protein
MGDKLHTQDGREDGIEAIQYAATPSTHSSDLDDNYEVYQKNADHQLDPAEAKRVLRKIDFRLVPILIVIYFLQERSPFSSTL